MRVLVSTVRTFLGDLREEGSTARWRERMLDLDGLNAFLGTSELLKSVGGSD